MEDPLSMPATNDGLHFEVPGEYQQQPKQQPQQPQQQQQQQPRARSPGARVLGTTELERNWKSTGMSSRESDRQFKFHVARMAQIYHNSGHGQTMVDNETPRTMKAPPPIVAERAAVRAYMSPSKNKSEAGGGLPHRGGVPAGAQQTGPMSSSSQRDWSDSFAHENTLLPQKERAMIAHWKGLNVPVPSKIQSPFEAAPFPRSTRPLSASMSRSASTAKQFQQQFQQQQQQQTAGRAGGSGAMRRPRSAPRPRGKFSGNSSSSGGGGGGGGGEGMAAQRLQRGGIPGGRVGGGGAKAAKHLSKKGAKAKPPGLSEAEVRVLEGRYELTPKQRSVYDAFATMLSDFDAFEMVQILEDALKDAQKATLLDDYYGAVDS